MKTKTVIFSLFTFGLVASCSDRDNQEPETNFKANLKSSIEPNRIKSDTIKIDQSQLYDKTGEEEGEPDAEIIPPGEVRPPKK
ncbi:hypothetical protein HZP39_04020 [Elizabethkingia anophelis]|nr:hypothetical protein [Elizabethkingia anophelis]MCT4239391.1 hypothetical protein [Elizabethkingia anophelis]MCT4282038.1 hypothetical protein [Elizabethkingia anophelis]MCT4292623.1 hypothetical protein [Elizabethkingia anophelis]